MSTHQVQEDHLIREGVYDSKCETTRQIVILHLAGEQHRLKVDDKTTCSSGDFSNYLISYRFISVDSSISLCNEAVHSFCTQLAEIISTTPLECLAMEGNQKAIYESILTRTKQIFANMMSGTADFAAVLAMFVRLRQSAVAPYLLVDSSKHQPSSSDDDSFRFTKESDAGFKAVKILKILDILESIPKDEKIVFFTSFTSYLDLLQEAIGLKLPLLSLFLANSTKFHVEDL